MASDLVEHVVGRFVLGRFLTAQILVGGVAASFPSFVQDVLDEGLGLAECFFETFATNLDAGCVARG